MYLSLYQQKISVYSNQYSKPENKISFGAINSETFSKSLNETCTENLNKLLKEEIKRSGNLTDNDLNEIIEIFRLKIKQIVEKINIPTKAEAKIFKYKPNDYMDYLLKLNKGDNIRAKEVINDKGEKEIHILKQYQAQDGSSQDYVAIIKNGQNATVYKPDGSIDYEVTYAEKEVTSQISCRIKRLWQEWFATKPGKLSINDMCMGKSNKVGYLKIITDLQDGSKSITKQLGDNIIKFRLDPNGKEIEYTEYVYNRNWHAEQLKMSRINDYEKNSVKELYYDEKQKVSSIKEIRSINGQKQIRWYDKDYYRINEDGSPYSYISEEEKLNEWYPVLSVKSICENLSSRDKKELTEKEMKFLAKIIGIDNFSQLKILGEDTQEAKVLYRKLSLQYHPDRNGGNPESEDIFKIISMLHNI